LDFVSIDGYRYKNALEEDTDMIIKVHGPKGRKGGGKKKASKKAAKKK
jgi:hypothetical protein